MLFFFTFFSTKNPEKVTRVLKNMLNIQHGQTRNKLYFKNIKTENHYFKL